MTTENNKYEPTAAERKLLEVLANPDYINASVTDICNAAGINRTTYYKAFKKKEFVAYQEKFTKDLLKQGLLPVIRSLEKEARKGSYQHQKLYLEMAGMYTEKKQHELAGKDGGPIQIESLSTEELKQKARELLSE